MKRIIAILCACLLLTGCGKGESYDGENMFVVVQSNWNYYKVVYHKDTKVMYAVSCGDRNGGNFTLLVNADGSPMLYEGEVEE